MTDIHVIPNAGTMLIEGSDGDGDGIGTARPVYGTIIIDGETAILHTDDGPAVVLADTPASLAFILAQAGLPGGAWPDEDKE